MKIKKILGEKCADKLWCNIHYGVTPLTKDSPQPRSLVLHNSPTVGVLL